MTPFFQGVFDQSVRGKKSPARGMWAVFSTPSARPPKAGRFQVFLIFRRVHRRLLLFNSVTAHYADLKR
jgi:hypothetical protein